MLKLIGAVFVSLSVSSVGWLKYSKYSKRVKYLEAVRQFSFGCADQMRFNKNNIFLILKTTKINELSFFKNITEENIADKVKLTSLIFESGVEPMDIELILNFLQGLGTSDIEGQTLHCKYYADAFESLLKDAKAELNEKGRLFRTVYLFAGVALFIILI